MNNFLRCFSRLWRGDLLELFTPMRKQTIILKGIYTWSSMKRYKKFEDNYGRQRRDSSVNVSMLSWIFGVGYSFPRGWSYLEYDVSYLLSINMWLDIFVRCDLPSRRLHHCVFPYGRYEKYILPCKEVDSFIYR